MDILGHVHALNFHRPPAQDAQFCLLSQLSFLLSDLLCRLIFLLITGEVIIICLNEELNVYLVRGIQHLLSCSHPQS